MKNELARVKNVDTSTEPHMWTPQAVEHECDNPVVTSLAKGFNLQASSNQARCQVTMELLCN